MDPSKFTFEALRAVIQAYKIPLGLGSVAFLCLLFSGVFLVKTFQRHEPIQFIMNQSVQGDATESGALGRRTIKVDVGGAVEKPGVYSLFYGARIEDAIVAAGGLASSVSQKILTKAVNRAQVISDGGKVYIPTLDDEKKMQDNILDGITTSHNIYDDKQGITTISINTASQNALESLSGVGPTIASKIIENRPYTSLEELVTKKIVGKKLYDKVKAQLTL